MVDIATHAEPPRKPKPNGKAPGTKKSKGEDVGPVFAPANPREARRIMAWLKDRITRARLLSKGEFITEPVEVSPVMAELILEHHNLQNRKIRQKRVDTYAEAMSDGRWQLTSQGISFSREGILNNGQHRLLAVIQSGRAIRMTVTFGEDREAFKVIDNHGVRTAGNILDINGVKYSNTVAAGAKAVLTIDSPLPLQARKNRNYPPDVIEDYVAGHPALGELAGEAHKIAGRLKCSSAAVLAAIYLIDRDSNHRHHLGEFMDKLLTGTELSKKSSILMLRDGLITRQFDTGREGGLGPVLIAAAIIKAWNRWLDGRTATKGALRFDKQKESRVPTAR